MKTQNTEIQWRPLGQILASIAQKLLLIAILFLSNQSFSAVINFTGATSSDWGTASNWVGGVLPSSVDVAYINGNKLVTIANGTTVLVQRISFGSGASLINNGTLNVIPTTNIITSGALYFEGNNSFTNNATFNTNNTSQTGNYNLMTFAGINNRVTFNGTNNLAGKLSTSVFVANASSSTTISGSGCSIGSSSAGANYSIFLTTGAGSTFTIDTGTTLNLHLSSGGNGFYMANSAAIFNNGTINAIAAESVGARALNIWQTTAAVSASFTNNGTFNITGFDAPTVMGGSTGNGAISNAGTLNIQNNSSTSTVGLNLGSSNLANVLSNSGTLNINSKSNAINLAVYSVVTNTGTITITKGNISSAATAGNFPIINNNLGGVFNFNYGIADGSTSATNNVLLSNNNGATINGSCSFAANTLATNDGGTLSAGDFDTSTGKSFIGRMFISPPTDAEFQLKGTVKMDINGTGNAGVAFDQIQCTKINVSNAAMLVNINNAYTPALSDYFTLIYAHVSKTGTMSEVGISRGWLYESVSTNEAVKYYPSVPGTPTLVVATAGNAQASIAFSAPASDGGADITQYSVSSTPETTTFTGTTSPLKITGLTNGTAYTFSVTATNIRGTSLETTSSSVTPDATANNINVSTSTSVGSLTLTPVSDILVSNGALLTINTPTTINSLAISAGGQVTNTSTFNASTLTINSNSVNGTGTFIDNGTSTITNTIANQYLGTTRNWYVSSPVVSTASSTNGIDKYFEYIEAGNNNDLTGQPSGSSAYWKGYNPGVNFMAAGKGYIALPSNTDASLQFSGSLNKGDVNVTLSKSGDGFNLIGNPYPSHLTWTQAFVTANSSKIEPTIWIRTKTGNTNTGGWSFSTYNALVGEIVPSWADVVIAPMQAFWIKAKVAGTLTLDNTLVRLHNTTNRLKSPALKNTDRQRVRLEVSNGISTDEALIYFDANASNSFDSYDSPKFTEASSVLQIFTTAGNEKLVINGMNSIPLDTPIGLGFVAGNATSFSIRANEITNIPANVKVIVKDNVTSAEKDLTDGVSTYEFNPANTSSDRFSIIFRTPVTVTGVNGIDKLNAQIFVNNANQIVIKSNEKANVSVYNVMGQKQYESRLTSTETTIKKAFVAGVYFVQLFVNGQSEIHKLIIR